MRYVFKSIRHWGDGWRNAGLDKKHDTGKGRIKNNKKQNGAGYEEDGEHVLFSGSAGGEN